MRVVALISGGKDSCYNLMQCVSEGHTPIALANLRPSKQDELDSYMYQTVGHQAIDLYAEALGLPLYRQTIAGSSLELGADYQCTEGDEVEDLYKLLAEIQMHEQIDAVSVGAILSDYQRVRVENVCARLGLSVLAYLWRRDQKELLQEMIDCGVHAIIIKVAALGLDPKKQLGRSIEEIYSHMLEMSTLYGLNVCGEGGEYETFTLDCPLFNKRIVVDESEMVMHSNDAFAPVAYLNLTKLHLEEKVFPDDISTVKRISMLPMKRSSTVLVDLSICEDNKEEVIVDLERVFNESSPINVRSRFQFAAEAVSAVDNLHVPCIRQEVAGGYVWIAGVVGLYQDDPDVALSPVSKEGTQDVRNCTSFVVHSAFKRLTDGLTKRNMSLKHLVAVHLYVSNMADFVLINQVYKTYFTANPPIRLCVQVDLPSDVALQLDCIAYHGCNETVGGRRTMHVQSISHWAPANIGPYSQAIQLSETIFVAGQIGLVPGSMLLVEGGEQAQCRLALRHCERIIAAMRPGVSLCHVTLAVCYVVSRDMITRMRREWERQLKQSVEADNGEFNSTVAPPLTLYVVVKGLPRQAAVEWHVVARHVSSASQESGETLCLPLRESQSMSYGSSHCMATVQSLYCRSVNSRSTLAFTIALEMIADSVVKPPILPSISSHDLLKLVMQSLKELLRMKSSNFLELGCLRIFYRSDCCVGSNLEAAYRQEFCASFICDDSKICPIALIPVLEFESSKCLFVVTHC